MMTNLHPYTALVQVGLHIAQFPPFFQSLFDQQPLFSCSTLGSSYIILITATAINHLAITVSDLYYVANWRRNLGSICCVCFGVRSEEHTSELQSRPHISYAVFCLKKKTKTKQNYKLTKTTTSHCELSS